MHVIAKPALAEFWKGHPDAENILRAWYRVMETEVFADFNDLRKTFTSADYVGGLTVFNIGGNKYRLIASIHYHRRKVYIRAVTHSVTVASGNGGNDELPNQERSRTAGYPQGVDTIQGTGRRNLCSH